MNDKVQTHRVNIHYKDGARLVGHRVHSDFAHPKSVRSVKKISVNVQAKSKEHALNKVGVWASKRQIPIHKLEHVGINEAKKFERIEPTFDTPKPKAAKKSLFSFMKKKPTAKIEPTLFGHPEIPKPAAPKSKSGERILPNEKKEPTVDKIDATQKARGYSIKRGAAGKFEKVPNGSAPEVSLKSNATKSAPQVHKITINKDNSVDHTDHNGNKTRIKPANGANTLDIAHRIVVSKLQDIDQKTKGNHKISVDDKTKTFKDHVSGIKVGAAKKNDARMKYVHPIPTHTINGVEHVHDNSSTLKTLKSLREETDYHRPSGTMKEVDHYKIVTGSNHAYGPGTVVGKAKTKKGANKSKDNHDNKYGAYAHRIVTVFKESINEAAVEKYAPKKLKDILTKPARKWNEYKGNTKDEQDIVDKINKNTVVHPDRNGNGDDVFTGSKLKRDEKAVIPGDDEKKYADWNGKVKNVE